jgi:hypothetical protein
MIWLWVGLLVVVLLLGAGLWLVVDLIRSLFRWVFSKEKTDVQS